MFKKSFLYCFFVQFIILPLAFGQSVRFQRDLTKKDNLWYYGNGLYTGEVITLNQDQIETRYGVENGVPSGLFIKYFWDNTFKKSNYKDTSEVRRLNQEIESENNKLNSLIKDSLLAYNELISYIKNVIGGDKKLQKLVEKKQANKLNEKKKILIDDFIYKQTSWKNLASYVRLQKIRIELTHDKLKNEESKPMVTPKIAEQYEQINFIKNGSYKSYYNNGKLKSEGFFLNDLYNGAWIYYYSNGNIQAKGLFVSGDGSDVAETSGLPRNGREGYWIFNHENGNIDQESNYLKGKLHGSFKAYNKNGILTEESFYKNDVLDGKSIQYNDKTIKISEANFINGIAEGEEKLYYDSGKLQIQRSNKQGKLDGVAKAFYENGNIQETISFVNGKRDGVLKNFSEGGGLQFEGAFKNDQKHGYFIVYYDNGKIKHKGKIDTASLAESHFIGEIYSYNEDGTLKTKIMAYQDGKMEDLTPKPSTTLSKAEMAKPYKCRCCKATINGVYNAANQSGEELSSLMLDFYLSMYEIPLLKKLCPTIYAYLRSEHPFCSMKCSKVCGK
jgi:antitoxin component YwqK of YwqJK toxin-antitoxin module